MTPYFFGRGTWANWHGVGVARGGGEGDEIVRSIAWLVRKFGGVSNFMEFVLTQLGGWSTLFPATPLSPDSGAYPYTLSSDAFMRNELGNERGVFLQDPAVPDRLHVWQREKLRADIVLLPGGDAQIVWNDDTVELVQMPESIREMEDRLAQGAEPVVVEFGYAEAPSDFAVAIRRVEGLRASLLKLAIANSVRDEARRIGASSQLFMLADGAKPSFTRRGFREVNIAVPIHPADTPLLRLSTLSPDGRWSNRLGAVMLSSEYQFRGQELGSEELRRAFAFTFTYLAGFTCDAVWADRRRTLIPDADFGTVHVGRAQQLLLLWASASAD